MNNNKVCFISVVDDEIIYNECIKFIREINIPDNFQIEIISVNEEKSVAKAYNEAMKSSDAKYKVYLKQGMFITNRNFIRDILKIFVLDKSIGMIGVLGTKKLSTRIFDKNDPNSVGKVYSLESNGINEINGEEVERDYTEVKAIDGLIIATQYDVNWREDLFDESVFYDISQSLQFGSIGYKVVVPNQFEPWCIFESTENYIEDLEKAKDIFWKEYKNVLPLVSILIPAYNQTKYLKEALESAINQTYPNIEIIIGDDSTNDDVRNFLEPYLSKYCNITYFKNQRDTMDYGLSNVRNLLKKSNGEYINYLNHDDVFHTQKIEKMINCFIENEDITVVTSVRQLIDTNGKKLPLVGAFKRMFENDTAVNGIEMSRFVIKNLMNCIGEPTTILFKKSYIDNFGEFNGKQFFNLMDVSVCFKLLQHGNIMYLSEALSYFRIHPNQNSNNMEIKIKGIIEWGELITESYRTSIIYDFTEYKATLYKWMQLFLPSLEQFINCNNVNIELKNKLEHAYKYAINQILH